MDSHRFDSMAQRFAAAQSRRSIIRDGFVAVAAALAGSRISGATAQARCSFAQVDCFHNQICVDGFCEDCPEGLAPCQTYCADLLSDPENCLFCGNVCSSGICEQSQCRDEGTCDPGLTSCSGQCVSLLTDVENCGACGEVCAGVSGPGFESPGQCVQGQCSTVCPPGAGLCDEECIDLATDSLNCGTCGNQCIVGTICCSSRCVSEGSAERFCESCGADEGWPQGCNDDETCERGLCVEAPPCEEGLSECGERNCVDLQTDPLNCGECGVECPDSECLRGECQEPPPPAEFADEGDAIAYLLSLERINQTLLQAGLNLPELEFIDETRTLMETMLGNDEVHVSTLLTLLADFGTDQPEAELPALAVPGSVSLFLQRMGRVKDLCISAYIDVLQRVPGLAGESGIGSIISMEARHAAFLAIQVENEPFGSDSEQPLSRPDVLAGVEALWRG